MNYYYYEKREKDRKKNYRKPSNKRGRKKSLFYLVIFVLVFFTYSVYSSIFNPVEKNNENTYILEIKEGENLKIVAQKLKDQDLIKSKTTFRSYAKFKNLESVFAGDFTLTKSMNVPEILEVINNPTVKEEIKITISEGKKITTIDQMLADQGVIATGEFINAVKNFDDWGKYPFLDQEKIQNLEFPLEGYLYPDTYFISAEENEAEILLTKMLDNFTKKISELGLDEEQTNHDLGLNSTYSLEEILTLASIVETEVRTYEDRQLVAGIYWKRLENNWRLEADITLLYEKTDRQITYEDLNSDSPYNTRKNLGLPPGPIGNPGIESIKATINFIPSEYWFYLNDPETGATIFATTNEEHNLNKNQYLY